MAAAACPSCKRIEWAGTQVVEPPRTPPNMWRRRTICIHCGENVDEIRQGGASILISRDQPTNWRGTNPFDDGDGPKR